MAWYGLDSEHGVRSKYRAGAVSQNHFVNDVAALDATERPKVGAPAVALNIDAQFMGHLPAAPRAVLLRARDCCHLRCLGKYGFHLNFLPPL